LLIKTTKIKKRPVSNDRPLFLPTNGWLGVVNLPAKKNSWPKEVIF